MVWLRILAIAGVASWLYPTVVPAADVPGNYSLPLPQPLQEKRLQRVELHSDWYLRGDLGYRFQRTGSATSVDPAQVPNPDSSTLDNAFLGGIGAGYKWDFFRIDVTGDYGLHSKYSAATAGVSTFDGKIDDFTLMLNGYADLGTWYGITPYIGAGVGAANVNFSSYEYPAAVPPTPSAAVPVHRWHAAWAAMAGLSYKIAPDFLIDIGYRHVEFGDVAGGPNAVVTIKQFSGDEIRVGLRYLIP